jgi:hypothetical protein
MARQAEDSNLDYCSFGFHHHLDRLAEPCALGLKAKGK